MSCVLARIEHAGPGGRARRLCFDDSGCSRTTAAAVVKELRLLEGITYDIPDLDRLISQAEGHLARERALVLLRQRERSSAETIGRLRDLGYSSAAIAGVIGRLQELDFLNDERFALMWARSRHANGYGRLRVLRELADKGVVPELAQETLAAVFSSETEVLDARRAIGNRMTGTKAEREKQIRRLLARGFDLGTVLHAVKLDDTDA
ncbi:MAG: regulatory protein RecX [Coriobacteriia bacterium]|nr:regulatory protein RecX [Coriobacteriia bacterium]